MGVLCLAEWEKDGGTVRDLSNSGMAVITQSHTEELGPFSQGGKRVNRLPKDDGRPERFHHSAFRPFGLRYPWKGSEECVPGGLLQDRLYSTAQRATKLSG